ncbi:ParB N-terminal domain-containing protein [Halobellus rubicundus]|uniref:ParB N-terminal domain-containing protein n=1 Tax=Halobellus rubicundus TaxID=2996466 RepID=A0ABD5MIN8_9EURY
MTDETPSLGAIVEDREHGSEAIVINTPSTTADEWHVQGRGTVAADNPTYPAGDPVVVVLHRPAYEEHFPLYSGGRPLLLDDLFVRDINHYAFPASRLETTGRVDTPTVPIEAIRPSPYHARSFDAEANRAFIDDIAEAGEPPGPPLVRVRSHDPLDLELLNGHKRTWAAAVAGLDEIPVWAIYQLGDVEAARAWANRHLDEYTGRQRRLAEQRLRDRLGAHVATDIIADHTGGTAHADD